MENNTQESSVYDPKYNPYLNYTPQIVNALYYRSIDISHDIFLNNVLTSFILAPFRTVFISLQLSVSPHRYMYSQQKEGLEKYQPKKSVELKKRIEFEIKSKVNKTSFFKAPVYDNYKQVLQGLWSQSIRGFYKGNLFHLMHLLSVQHLQVRVLYPLQYQSYFIKKQKNYYLRQCEFMIFQYVIQWFNTVIRCLETKFIIQHAKSEFRDIKNIKQILKFPYSELWVGHRVNFYIIPIRQLLFIFGVKCNLDVFQIFALMELITYPLQTVQRRLEGQSGLFASFIPLRYQNVNHAIRLIYQEEGFRGFYRGFSCFCVYLGLSKYLFNINDPKFYQLIIRSIFKTLFMIVLFLKSKNWILNFIFLVFYHKFFTILTKNGFSFSSI